MDTNIYQSIPNRTAEHMRAEFQRLGLSVAEWARANGFSAPLVYQVLSGKKRCIRGQSHQIAIRLGMKHGEIGTIEDVGRAPTRTLDREA